MFTGKIKLPSGWSLDSGEHKGNFNGVLTVVSPADDAQAQPPDGKNCLKLYYDQPVNKIIPLAALNTLPANPKTDYIFDPVHGLRAVDAPLAAADAPVNTCAFQVTLPRTPEMDKPYELSFKVKGDNFSASFSVGVSAIGEVSPSKITRGERGSAYVQKNELRDADVEDGTFGPSTSWTTVTKSVTFHFAHNPKLNDPKKWKGSAPIHYTGSLLVRVDLSPFKGVCYVDDVELVPKK